MRKLKSQIIYSSVRAGTVLNSNRVHSGGNWHRTASMPPARPSALSLRLHVHLLLTALRRPALTSALASSHRHGGPSPTTVRWARALPPSGGRTPSAAFLGQREAQSMTKSTPCPRAWAAVMDTALTSGLDAFRPAGVAVLGALHAGLLPRALSLH